MDSKEEWGCCKCPKSRAKKHEELWSFGKFGNNELKIELGRQDKQYCKECFDIVDQELEDKASE